LQLPNVVGFIFGVAQMILYGVYRKYDKESQKQKLPEQIKDSSPVKQSNEEIHPINSLPTNDTTLPQPVHDEIEVVVANPGSKEGNFVNKDNLLGPPAGPPCYSDAQKIFDGPIPPAVQLVQCAV